MNSSKLSLLSLAGLPLLFAGAACTASSSQTPGEAGSGIGGVGNPVGGMGGDAGASFGGSQVGGSAGQAFGGAGMGGQGGVGGGGLGGQGGLGGAGMGGVGGAAGMGGLGGSAAGGSGGNGAGGNGGSSGGGTVPPDPSDGCGTMNPQTGSGQSPLNVSNHQYYVKLPNNYDPNTPYRTMFVFNPTNNPITWAENSAGYEQTEAQDLAIRVYPHPQNSGAGWNSSDEPFFQPLYDSITSNFCVDKARVFAGGESSGGDFSSLLGCDHADKLRVIAPCATKPIGGFPPEPGQRQCAGQVTPIIIHGIRDNVVGTENGPKTRDFYKEVNNCGDATEPVEGYTDELSNCVRYTECDAGFPLYWCNHNDPEYSNTNHGWPRFAAAMTWETFKAY